MPAIHAMMAITWNALIQRYNMSCPPHASDQLLDALDRCLRQDAVPEIEDVRASAHRLQDMIGPPGQRLASGDQRQRIQIALGRHMSGKTRQHVHGIERPVEGKPVADAGSREAMEMRTAAAHEDDDLRLR